MNLKPYICKYCGGRINVAKMKCEYCDTSYEDNSLRRIKIETVRPGQHTIRAEIALDTDGVHHNPEGARDYALRALREQLADGLLGFMKIQTSESFDPRYFGRTEIIRGEVRVIDPSFNDCW